MVEQVGDGCGVILDRPPSAWVIETSRGETCFLKSLVQPRERAARATEAVQQDDQAIDRSLDRPNLVKGLDTLLPGTAADDPTLWIEQPAGLAVPTALQSPSVTPSSVGPKLRAGRLDHPPRSSLSLSWIWSSVG